MSIEEATISLNLTEYETSILVGALAEYVEKWSGSDAGVAQALRERVEDQVPRGWVG